MVLEKSNFWEISVRESLASVPVNSLILLYILMVYFHYVFTHKLYILFIGFLFAK
jgi:hypothetical protein